MDSKGMPSRTVFVLDVSSSMSQYGRLQKLQLSAMRHLADIPEGCYVGIVWFCETARTEHEVVEITDQSVRKSLINKLPKRTEFGTDIGSGILEGLCALRRTGLSTEGATIALVTDGEHYTFDPIFGYNYVAKVMPELISAKVRVNCIAIGTGADPNLESVSKATKGNTHTTPTYNCRGMSTRVMRRALTETSEESSPMSSTSSPLWITPNNMSENISVCNELLPLNSGVNDLQVIIDPDIGRNTSFTIEYEDMNLFTVSLIGPKGKEYQFNQNIFLKRYELFLNYSESGFWTIRLISNSNQTLFVNVLVLSQSISQNQIRMTVKIEEAKSDCPPIIIAELNKGSDGVIGAEVTATVDRPDGTQSKVKLINYNNIYCNYFADYCGSGRYNVSVLAKSFDSEELTLLKTIKTNNSENSQQKVHPFQRQQIIGSFKIDKYMVSKPLSGEKLEEVLALSKLLNSLSVLSPIDVIHSTQPIGQLSTFLITTPPLNPMTNPIEDNQQNCRSNDDSIDSFSVINENDFKDY